MKTLILLLGFSLPAFFLSGQSNASINKAYFKENFKRINIVPVSNSFQYEPISVFDGNSKIPKPNSIVFVKIKTFYIDGSSVEEKEAKIDLTKLGNDKNSVNLKRGIRKMNIGDVYRFFISQKIDYDTELHVHIASPLIKVYEVELMDILQKDGTSKFPKETARYKSESRSDNFDTAAIFKIAKQKAYVKAERARLEEERRIRANQIYGQNRYNY